jgi:FkbM family methyltransferase
MTSVLTRKCKTALRVLRDQGAERLSTLARENVAIWRHRKGNCALLDGCLFELDGLEPGIARLLLLGDYEFPERAAVSAFVDSQTPVIELGACMGVVSCLTNRKLKNTDRHVAVEANPAMIDVLRRNAARNQCRFSILARAVGYDDAPFYVSENVLASGIKSSGSPIPVEKTNLREIAERFAFDQFTLICDIEGTEVEMVEQEGDLLAERCKLIVLETHEKRIGDAPIEKMYERLSSLGFFLAHRIGDTSVYKHESFLARGLQ